MPRTARDCFLDGDHINTVAEFAAAGASLSDDETESEEEEEGEQDAAQRQARRIVNTHHAQQERSTKRTYKSSFKKFKAFCATIGADPEDFTLQNAIDYWVSVYEYLAAHPDDKDAHMALRTYGGYHAALQNSWAYQYSLKSTEYQRAFPMELLRDPLYKTAYNNVRNYIAKRPVPAGTDPSIGTASDSYTIAQYTAMITGVFLTAFTNVKHAFTIVCMAFMHQTLARSNDLRLINFSGMMRIVECACVGPSKVRLFNFFIRNNKVNKGGKLQYIFLIRHLNHKLCALGLLARWLFLNMGKTRHSPDVAANYSAWASFPIFGTAESGVAVSYNMLNSYIKPLLITFCIFLFKVCHAFRAGGAQCADLAGAPLDQIKRLGGWNREVVLESYLTNAPLLAILALAGCVVAQRNLHYVYFHPRFDQQIPALHLKYMLDMYQQWLVDFTDQITRVPQKLQASPSNCRDMLEALFEILVEDCVHMVVTDPELASKDPICRALYTCVYFQAACLAYKRRLEQLQHQPQQQQPTAAAATAWPPCDPSAAGPHLGAQPSAAFPNLHPHPYPGAPPQPAQPPLPDPQQLQQLLGMPAPRHPQPGHALNDVVSSDFFKGMRSLKDVWVQYKYGRPGRRAVKELDEAWAGEKQNWYQGKLRKQYSPFMQVVKHLTLYLDSQRATSREEEDAALLKLSSWAAAHKADTYSKYVHTIAQHAAVRDAVGVSLRSGELPAVLPTAPLSLGALGGGKRRRRQQRGDTEAETGGEAGGSEREEGEEGEEERERRQQRQQRQQQVARVQQARMAAAAALARLPTTSPGRIAVGVVGSPAFLSPTRAPQPRPSPHVSPPTTGPSAASPAAPALAFSPLTAAVKKLTPHTLRQKIADLHGRCTAQQLFYHQHYEAPEGATGGKKGGLSAPAFLRAWRQVPVDNPALQRQLEETADRNRAAKSAYTDQLQALEAKAAKAAKAASTQPAPAKPRRQSKAAQQQAALQAQQTQQAGVQVRQEFQLMVQAQQVQRLQQQLQQQQSLLGGAGGPGVQLGGLEAASAGMQPPQLLHVQQGGAGRGRGVVQLGGARMQVGDLGGPPTSVQPHQPLQTQQATAGQPVRAGLQLGQAGLQLGGGGVQLGGVGMHVGGFGGVPTGVQLHERLQVQQATVGQLGGAEPQFRFGFRMHGGGLCGLPTGQPSQPFFLQQGAIGQLQGPRLQLGGAGMHVGGMGGSGMQVGGLPAGLQPPQQPPQPVFMQQGAAGQLGGARM